VNAGQNQNFEMEDSRAEITEVLVKQFPSARPEPRAIDAAWWWWLRLNIQPSASNLPCLGFPSSFGSRCRKTSQGEDIVDSLTPFHSRRLNFNGICEASNTDVRCRFPASFDSRHRSLGDVKASPRLTILRWSVVCLLFPP
jgi:hypothetical protein